MEENKIRDEYAMLTRLLIAKKLTISTMESATGGQIASLLTDTEGSSSVIKGAFVTYCNEAKIMQGVKKETIEKHSVYSEQVAGEMAECCAKAYGADVGIGVTGTMGNIDPVNKNASIPGNLYYAVYYKGKTKTYHSQLEAQASRLQYKLEAVHLVYEKLMDCLG